LQPLSFLPLEYSGFRKDGNNRKAPKGKSESPWSLHLSICGLPLFIVYLRRTRIRFLAFQKDKSLSVAKIYEISFMIVKGKMREGKKEVLPLRNDIERAT
jgi:hypothetical protein